MSFASDNTTGVAAEILAALEAANAGPAVPYGDDPWTARATARFAEVFERPVAVFPVAAGTAANALALAAVTPPWGAVLCHRLSHVNQHQCGAPEFYTGGAKLIPLEGDDGKLTPASLDAAVVPLGPGESHRMPPSALSLTQVTELGTVYEPDQVAALAAAARRHGLAVHMDGARFANAVAALGCSPAAVTWRAGVDVLAFGATKNGAMNAEAVVFFRQDLAADFERRWKRGGHRLSKMRFVSAQLEASLRDDLWLRCARHANAMASRLATGLTAVPAVRLLHPVAANMVYAIVPDDVLARLAAAGLEPLTWPTPDGLATRLVTAFDTRAEEVDGFVAAARG